MMRYGFTTGSCAAAASKAAAYMLLTGKLKKNITIQTPKGILFQTEILETTRSETEVTCAVRKDGGDDPDITSGTLIFSTVRFAAREKKIPGQNNRQFSGIHVKAMQEKRAVICIDGGKGVGRVTKPGLDQQVGNAAINHVPREMIEKEVQEVCALADFSGELHITISVPDGEHLAEQTFNPRLGIVGGISILGTSGIVEPMSSQALLDTIKVELNQKKAEGYGIAAVSPGNYGLDYMKKTYGYDLDRSVKCSNFIGDTIDMAITTGFEKMLLTGHIGRRNHEHTFQRGRLPYGSACRSFCEKSGALSGFRGNPAMCHHGRSSQETGCLWEKRCCDAGSTVKNHVLSEQTGGRKNADRGYPLLQ